MAARAGGRAPRVERWPGSAGPLAGRTAGGSESARSRPGGCSSSAPTNSPARPYGRCTPPGTEAGLRGPGCRGRRGPASAAGPDGLDSRWESGSAGGVRAQIWRIRAPGRCAARFRHGPIYTPHCRPCLFVVRARPRCHARASRFRPAPATSLPVCVHGNRSSERLSDCPRSSSQLIGTKMGSDLKVLPFLLARIDLICTLQSLGLLNRCRHSLAHPRLLPSLSSSLYAAGPSFQWPK